MDCVWHINSARARPDGTCGRPAKWVANAYQGPDNPPGPDSPVCGIHRRSAENHGYLLRPLEETPDA